MQFDKMLSVEHLRKSVRGKLLLDAISLTVRPGEVVGVLGPAGAGKSLLVAAIMGMTPIDAGQIRLGGSDLTRASTRSRIRAGLALLTQDASPYRRFTFPWFGRRRGIERNLLGLAKVVERDRGRRERMVGELMEQLAIRHLRDVPPISFSGGERRRYEIACALVTRPTILVLDEPLTGIDPIASTDITMLLRHFRDGGLGVLVTGPMDRDLLGACERAYILSQGRIVEQGRPGEIVFGRYHLS